MPLSKKATSICQPARFGPNVSVTMRFHCSDESDGRVAMHTVSDRRSKMYASFKYAHGMTAHTWQEFLC